MARTIPLLFLILSAIPTGASTLPQTVQLGRFGAVPVIWPTGEPSQVALLLSNDQALAQALAAAGFLVFETDVARYLRLAAGGQTVYPAADFEALSQSGQQALGLPSYHPPLLVGTDAGAALAYAVLAEAPPRTFAGAVSVGFCPRLPAVKLRRGNGLQWEKSASDQTLRLRPDPRIEDPWIVLDVPGQACAAGTAADFARAIPTARVVPAPAGAPREDGWRHPLAQALAVLAEARRQEEAADASRGELRDLPLTEVAASGPAKDVLAIIVSGSGGFVGFDRKMGRNLAERGVPVVGLSSLAYFWKPRDPDGAARDLARILAHYLAAWHKDKALLIGYSQGADVLPFMVNRLPTTLRSKVGAITLIGPDGSAQFVLHPELWLIGRAKASPELPEAPEIPKLQGTSVLCVFGAAEKKSLCRETPPGLASVLEVPGGHSFDGDAPAIAERSLAVAGVL
jgi:type IV secretory pathway VirJ component